MEKCLRGLRGYHGASGLRRLAMGKRPVGFRGIRNFMAI